MLRLRILCGVYNFKNAIEILLLESTKSIESLKFVSFLLILFLLKTCSYGHFRARFELERNRQKSLEKNVFRLHINISAGRDNYIINAQHTWSFSRNRESPFRCIGCGLYQFPHKVKNVFYQTYFSNQSCILYH